MAQQTEIEKRFATALSGRVPTTDQKLASAIIQAKVLDLARQIDGTVPNGRWKSLALTSLEETLMWANKAVFNEDAT